MEILDPSFLLSLASQSPLALAWFLFTHGGWIVLLITIVRGALILRLYRLENKYLADVQYVLLAIDIPKDSEQTPKAMEQVFATISGAHQEINKRAKYFKGEVQMCFSFEIISIDGYVQFLVRTPKVYRDLAEGAIYSQYPDCEITEVEDYTKSIPSNFPNDQYKIWGSELVLARNEAYPIRTYRFFEDQLSQELKDPLASVIETMSRIQQNEQVWLQIIVCPTENTEWVKRVLNTAYKLAGKKKVEGKGSIFDTILGYLYNLPSWISWLGVPAGDSKKDNALDFRVLNLTPGERATIEAIENKASKVGFICKLRLIYLSPHEQYQSARVVNSVFGSIKQFNDLVLNSLKPNKLTKTSVVWFNVENRVNARRRRIMRNYKARSWFLGSKYYILNAEELATLYHFPSLLVASPYLKRTEAKKSDAPVGLPSVLTDTSQPGVESLREQLTGLDLNNDYYERRYGKYRVAKPARPDPLKSDEKNDTSGIPDNLPIQQ